MEGTIRRMLRHLRRGGKRAGNAVIGPAVIGLLKVMRLIDPDVMANVAASFMRTVGPLLPEHRIARSNLAAAFPEKSSGEIEKILRGTWDNLGRIGAEFAGLDRIWDYDPIAPKPDGRIQLV